MRNNESVNAIMDWLQTKEEKELQYNEEIILYALQNTANDQSSLAIKIVSVIGGLFASWAFLGFFFIAGLSSSGFGLLFFGALSIVAAIGINKKFEKTITDTLSVSTYLIGFFLMGFGFTELDTSINIINLLFIGIALISLILARSYILSFVSILIINGSIISLILSNNEYDLIHLYVSALALLVTYFFMKEAKIISGNKTLSKLYNPIRIGLIFSFLIGLILLGKKGLVSLSPEYIWLTSVTIIASILFLLPVLFNILNITKRQHKVSIYIFSIILLLPTALSPAISGAILIILLTFLVNYKTGLTIGIVAFIYFISQYYYDLNFTLLTKSLLLISSGILFILISIFTHKKIVFQ